MAALEKACFTRDAALVFPLPVSAALRPGNLWADVNDVVAAFIAIEANQDPDVPLWPKATVALLAAHKVDGPALLEMTVDDVRDSLGIVEPAHQRNFLAAIRGIADAANEHFRAARRLPPAAVQVSTVEVSVAVPAAVLEGPPEVVSSALAPSLGKHDDDDDDDDDMPKMEDFTFVETAIRKNTTAVQQAEREQQIEVARVNAGSAKLKTFATRRIDPRSVLPLYAAASV